MKITTAIPHRILQPMVDGALVGRREALTANAALARRYVTLYHMQNGLRWRIPEPINSFESHTVILERLSAACRLSGGNPVTVDENIIRFLDNLRLSDATPEDYTKALTEEVKKITREVPDAVRNKAGEVIIPQPVSRTHPVLVGLIIGIIAVAVVGLSALNRGVTL